MVVCVLCKKMRRTIIIGVDNRAAELHKDFGIPVVLQEDIVQLENIIASEFSTKIKLPNEKYKKFS